MKKMITALLCATYLTSFAMKDDDSVALGWSKKDFNKLNTVSFHRQAEAQERTAKSAELYATSKAMKHCMQLITIEGYKGPVTQSDCDNLAKKFLGLSGK